MLYCDCSLTRKREHFSEKKFPSVDFGPDLLKTLCGDLKFQNCYFVAYLILNTMAYITLLFGLDPNFVRRITNSYLIRIKIQKVLFTWVCLPDELSCENLLYMYNIYPAVNKGGFIYGGDIGTPTTFSLLFRGPQILIVVIINDCWVEKKIQQWRTLVKFWERQMKEHEKTVILVQYQGLLYSTGPQYCLAGINFSRVKFSLFFLYSLCKYM